MKMVLAAMGAAAMLAACGGGDDTWGSAPLEGASAAQGVWAGTTSTNRTVRMLVFSDGSYWLFYTLPGSPLMIAGSVQGTVQGDATTFASTDGRDYNLQGLGVLAPGLSGSYEAKQSLTAALMYPDEGDNITLSTHYDSSYDLVPTLAAIAGSYVGQAATLIGTQSAGLRVSANGNFIGASEGCSISGTLTPRTDGNAYDASISFGPSPCVFASQTLTGIAEYDAPSRSMVLTGPNAERTDSFLFVGAQPSKATQVPTALPMVIATPGR